MQLDSVSMPEQANLCSLLVELKRDVSNSRLDAAILKHDVCDMVDARICELVKQVISTPYCNNFCFEIDKPPEQDSFDRVALQYMETSDDVIREFE
jgi:23S rRNA C2498 (ribose-2'-O)-methylase RlmM